MGHVVKGPAREECAGCGQVRNRKLTPAFTLFPITMKTSRRLFFAGGIFAFGAGLPLFPQVSQQTQQITVTAVIPVLMNLTVDTSTVTFNFTQSDYAADGTGSKQVVNATTFKIASNTRWILQVSADNLNFTYSPGVAGTANPNKSCGDLSLSPNGTANFVPVTNLNREIARGEAGGNTVAANSIPVSYKLNTTVAKDPPGTYTLTVTYTLIPQ
jgi:hypothetical protein